MSSRSAWPRPSGRRPSRLPPTSPDLSVIRRRRRRSRAAARRSSSSARWSCSSRWSRPGSPTSVGTGPTASRRSHPVSQPDAVHAATRDADRRRGAGPPTRRTGTTSRSAIRPDWTVVPATGGGAPTTDVADPLSPAHEAFVAPAGGPRERPGERSWSRAPLRSRPEPASSRSRTSRPGSRTTARRQGTRRAPGSTSAPSSCASRSGTAIPACSCRSRTTSRRSSAVASTTPTR